MRRKRNILILILVLITPVLGVLLYYFAWSFAPGSYGRAEIYEFNISEETLIDAIYNIKSEDSSLVVPKQTGLTEGRKDSTVHWYSIYFYYSEKNQILKTWTRPISDMKTSFGFVAINDGLKLGNWKEVNENFLWWKNTPVKQEFEERILEKIKTEINKTKPNTQ